MSDLQTRDSKKKDELILMDDSSQQQEVEGGTTGIVSSFVAKVNTENPREQIELTNYFENFMEVNKVPPVYIVQLFLKAEPKENQVGDLNINGL